MEKAANTKPVSLYSVNAFLSLPIQTYGRPADSQYRGLHKHTYDFLI